MIPFRRPFTPADWYWIVAGSKTQVFASARSLYVAPADPTYVGWLAKGGLPTRIPAEQDLWDVLTVNGVPLPAAATSAASPPIAAIVVKLQQQVAALNAKVGIAVVA